MRENKSKFTETDERGRILNADSSAFVFYPRTVLRAEDTPGAQNSDSGKLLLKLADAMNTDDSGSIGALEINILQWVETLRYVTSIMLLDLISAGYISDGKSNDITQKKLGGIIRKMSGYNLITAARFVSVNDDGSPDGGSRSAVRIITMGRNGSVLLHELGKNASRFNPFDVLRDGNTVKRRLAANQWLIYWLANYKEHIGGNYETDCVVRQKGTEYSETELCASVTVNGVTMIAEPVRRTESFEAENGGRRLRERIKKMLLMFNNSQPLFHGRDELRFSEPPIIVIICEDDSHIREVWETLAPVLSENRLGKIWFTSDLRIFNDNKSGERFLRFDDGKLRTVSLGRVLGTDNGAADN